MSEKGYKNTAVGVIPEDWEVKKLGKILKIGSGKDYKHLENGNIPVYGTGGIMTFVNDFLYDGESIGVGRKGTIDKPQFLTGKFWTVDTLFYTHSFNDCLPKFLYYKFLQINWYKYNEASGVPSLSKKTIEKIQLSLPPLPEQKAIAEVLSTWDKAIEQYEALLQQYELRKKWLMQNLLTGKKRLEGFEGEWKEVRLGDVTLKKNSKVQANKLTENSGNFPVYGASGFVTNVDFYSEDFPYIAIVKDGSGVGNLFYLEGKSSVLGTLDIIQTNTENLFFIYNILHNLNFNKFIVGGAIPHIYYKDYKIEKLLIPSIEEQTAIANILQTADKEIELTKERIERLREQKKGLMQVLLTGKKRLKEKID